MVRASDCQCTSCNGPGFDPVADEAVLNIVRKTIPPKIHKKNIYLRCPVYESYFNFLRLVMGGCSELVRGCLASEDEDGPACLILPGVLIWEVQVRYTRYRALP